MPDKHEIFRWTVPPGEEGCRLDLFLVRMIPNLSRTRVQTMIRDGLLTVAGEVCLLPKRPLTAGETVLFETRPPERPVKAEGEKIPLDILYEDDSILVVNKVAGMVVHPAAGNWSGTLVNALLGRETELPDDEDTDPLRPGIVHRLDKETSGALVIAKTPRAHQMLSKAFAEREVEKVYLAIVHGWPVPHAAVLKTAFGRHKTDRRKMTVLRSGEGREAVSAYQTLCRGMLNGSKVALLQVRLHTGRTHQIRVHMAHIGHPLVGERLYNRGRVPILPRQMLHAWKLMFDHPLTGKHLSFEAPPPVDFRQAVNELSKGEKNAENR